jgi:hypothetical protein
MKRFEETLMELLHKNTAPTYAELIAKARQIRPVCTNPANYKEKELDLPLIGEFMD